MKNMTFPASQTIQAPAIEALTTEEVRLIRNVRAMRSSARKMVFDLSTEYASDFPDPDTAGSAPS